MELISFVVLGILGVVGATCARVLADEFKAWSPRLVSWLIRRAVRKLPADLHERMLEEWQSHVAEVPGEIGKLIVALSLQRAAKELRSPVPLMQKFVAFALIVMLLPLIGIIFIFGYASGNTLSIIKKKRINILDDSKQIEIYCLDADRSFGRLMRSSGYDIIFTFLFEVVRGNVSFGTSLRKAIRIGLVSLVKGDRPGC